MGNNNTTFNSATTEQTYLEPQMVERLSNIFDTEDKYTKIVSDLWKTRTGIYNLIENNPNQPAKDLFIALNEVVACFLPKDDDLFQKIQEKSRA